MTATVGYLTKRFPRLSETFILDEILGLEAAGVPLRLYAIADPHENLVQPDVTRVASPVRYLTSHVTRRARLQGYGATLVAHVRLLARAPRRYLGVVVYIVRRRRHLSTMRNFVHAGRLAVQLRDDDARHLHAAFAHGPASVAHFVHLLTGLPFSFSAHAKDIYVSAPDLLARKIAAASFVLTCSASARDALTPLAGVDGAKVVLAHHGVDTSRFIAPSPSSPPAGDDATLRVLAVGRLVAKKGYPVLVRALRTLSDEGRRVQCTIVGAGSDRDELEALVEELGLRATVTFVGSQTHHEVVEWFRHADVFVQASVVLANGDRDGIPNSLLEAMASGLAVVASDVAGIPEVLTANCGLLVPPGDSAALARALGCLADDPARRAELGRRARSHVEANFDRAVCTRRIAPLFEVRAADERVPAAARRDDAPRRASRRVRGE